MYESHALAAAGSTGNNTHSALYVGGTYESVAFQFRATAVGATPTVSWKIQGSPDGTNYFDLGYITDASDTVATATRAVTTVSAQINFLSNPVARRYKYFRLVTSANTNVTYAADIYTIG